MTSLSRGLGWKAKARGPCVCSYSVREACYAGLRVRSPGLKLVKGLAPAGLSSVLPKGSLVPNAANAWTKNGDLLCVVTSLFLLLSFVTRN
ncbi:hypothetical protein BDW67DRAFT_137517 [Aspergillus spinulosporus]